MAVKVAVIDPGFGGMALGFKEAGFNVTVVFDKYVKAPENIPDSDVIAVNLIEMPPLCHADRPQDKRREITYDYFTAVCRMIESKRPKAFCLVMQKGMHKNPAFIKTLNDFQMLGYFYEYKVINSGKMTGLPVNEERLYLLGYRNDISYIKFPDNPDIGYSLSIRKLFGGETVEEEYYKINYEQIEEKTDDDCFLCWRKDRYIERPYADWNLIKMPLVRIDGKIHKLTPCEMAKLKGIPEEFNLGTSKNKTKLYRMLAYTPNVQVIQRIAYQLKNNLMQTPLKRMQEQNGAKFERIFAMYLDKKTGKKREPKTGQDGRWDYEYIYHGVVYYFNLKFYNSNSVAGDNILRVCQRLAKNIPTGDRKIILAVANTVSDEIKYICEEQYNIFIWDVKNLIWMFEEFPEIRNEFIALLNFPTEDMKAEKPRPDLFAETEEKHGIVDLKEKLRQIRPGHEEYQQYENVCIEILKYVLGDYLTLWYAQEKTDNGMYRFDLCCKIKNGVDQDFFETIKHYFNTKYIVFEFKNYSERITQQEIYTTEKYLYEKALRRVAFIISRNGADENALAAARGSLRESGKLILCLSDKDLMELIDIKEKNEQPAGLFFEAMLDDLLIHLEK